METQLSESYFNQIIRGFKVKEVDFSDRDYLQDFDFEMYSYVNGDEEIITSLVEIDVDRNQDPFKITSIGVAFIEIVNEQGTPYDLTEAQLDKLHETIIENIKIK